MGTCYLHTVIDDHSRVAYVEAHDDETKDTTAQVLRNTVAWFNARGVTVERALTDNGGYYRPYPWRDTCDELGITHKRWRGKLATHWSTTQIMGRSTLSEFQRT